MALRDENILANSSGIAPDARMRASANGHRRPLAAGQQSWLSYSRIRTSKTAGRLAAMLQNTFARIAPKPEEENHWASADIADLLSMRNAQVRASQSHRGITRQAAENADAS